jgi:hypothetical protein
MRKQPEEAEIKKVPEAAKFALEIDENDLLGECRRQMELEAKYGALLAKAEYMLNATQTAVKTRRSELILKVESDPSVINGSKNTQTVEAYYRTQKSYQRLVQQETDAQFNYTQIQNAMFSLSRRSAMLQILVNARLRLSGSFDPTKDTPQGELRKLENDEVNNRLKGRLKKGE